MTYHTYWGEDIWGTPGRKYGRGKYGRNTYDHFRAAKWSPIPPEPLVDIWIPIIEPAQPPWVPVNG